MSTYTYPASDYDRPRNLLAVLGSLWAETYMGAYQPQTHVEAKGQVENQSLLDLMEVIDSAARRTVPIFHKDNWYALRLLASERNTAKTALARYDDGQVTYDDGSRYDVPQDVLTHAWPAPDKLVDVQLVMNRFTEPSLIWNDGIDYTINQDGIVFLQNPFDDPRVAKRTIYEDGIAVDEEALLWLFRGDFDWENIYYQYGYVLNMRLQSSKTFRDLMNAVFDALVGGMTARQIQYAFAALTGVPLVLEPTEVIEDISRDNNHRLIITDQHVYKFAEDVLPIVEIGDTVHAGDPLVDALQIWEFNRGFVPPDLRALAMGRGFLATCYYGDLVFENRDVPLEVVEAEDDPTGYTRVSFGLGGFPLDVEKFFDEIHERGVAYSELPIDPCEEVPTIFVPGDECNGVPDQHIRIGTLAHVLDQRPEKVGEPTAAALPSHINPLRFLIQNILRNNAYLIRVKTRGLGRDALGLYNARYLHKVVPPHTAMILLYELSPETDSIAVDQITESMTTFQGMGPLTDTIDDSLIREPRFGIRVISGTCQ